MKNLLIVVLIAVVIAMAGHICGDWDVLELTHQFGEWLTTLGVENHA